MTDAANVEAAGALMDSELTSIADVKALDQSVVSGAAPVFDGTNFTNIPAGTVDVVSNVATARILGRTTAGTGDSEELTAAATRTLLNVEDGATADQTGAQIKTAYEAEANAFTDTKNTKLSGIESGADVTDATNVTAAGALMDSEVTNLAQVKAFDSTDYATSAQGTTADNALQARGAVNAQTGTTYTLVIGDEYLDGVRMTNASANTITIPPNADVALPVGTKVFITQGGAGSTTIAAGAGVTINAPSTVTLAIGEQHESRVCQKTATDTWLII